MDSDQKTPQLTFQKAKIKNIKLSELAINKKANFIYTIIYIIITNLESAQKP